jgi:mannosyltransferase
MTFRNTDSHCLGFFYERWSDSPIHSFALAMLLKKEEVVQFRDMG